MATPINSINESFGAKEDFAALERKRAQEKVEGLEKQLERLQGLGAETSVIQGVEQELDVARKDLERLQSEHTEKPEPKVQ